MWDARLAMPVYSDAIAAEASATHSVSGATCSRSLSNPFNAKTRRSAKDAKQGSYLA